MATSEMHDADSTAGPKGATGSARWTWLAGGALLAGAAVAAIAPRLLPETAPAAAALARHGLTWPLLGGFGLVLAAIASAARRAREETSAAPAVPEPAAAPAEDPLARETANELARVRGALHDLRVEFVYVKDGLGRLLQSAGSVDADANRETEAAIFRLAASLDQLGGRIEHELATQRTWLVDAIERDARRAAAPGAALPVGLAGPAHGGASGALPPGVAGTLPGYANPYAQGFEGAPHEIDVEEGYRASPQDLHVEVSLEDELHWPPGLGVLDEIDEPRAPLGAPNGKTSWSGRPPAAGGLFDPIESGAAELEGKLAQLRQILADPAVQRALDTRA